MSPTELEHLYHQFTTNLGELLPEGVVEVDLALLEATGLLESETLNEDQAIIEQLPYYFHVVETSDKVMLFNHQFVVWIAPKVIQDVATTLIMIALVKGEKVNLEVAFSTQGAYNTPKCILKLLRYYLSEVIDTEQTIASIGQNDLPCHD